MDKALLPHFRSQQPSENISDFYYLIILFMLLLLCPALLAKAVLYWAPRRSYLELILSHLLSFIKMAASGSPGLLQLESTSLVGYNLSEKPRQL